jgi:NADPH-dependent curcumin reductase
MSTTTHLHHQYLLKARPTGRVSRDNFELRTSPLRDPGPGEVLVRTRYLSLDPTNRIWMTDAKQYMPPVQLGEVMRGQGLGVVERSQHPGFQPGDLVSGLLGWQDYYVGAPEAGWLAALPKLPVPDTAWLCPLNLTGGYTAYFGLFDVGQPKPGETVVVSGAAGSVGSLVGQMAKIAGCRVVGIAGSDEGCRYVTQELGFDACINYKTENVDQALKRHCPGGVDLNFENVGGDILDTVLDHMKLFGRVVVCGLISQYNATQPVPGPTRFPLIVMQRLRVQGFVVTDYAARFGEATEKIAGWMQQGRLKWREVVVEGLENAPEHLNLLFQGQKVGKLVLKVSG